MNKIKDRTVLIVDDSKLMRFLLKNIVDGMKFFSKIYEAENGRDCLLYTSPSPRDKTVSRMPSSA